jgi:peptidase aspartic
MINIQQILNEYVSISLEEMSGIKLMNRTDTKFVTSQQVLKRVLFDAKHDYRVQAVNGEQNIAYHTVYLDTADRTMYMDHQNGRTVREKIRVRTYVSSGLTFLEIKNKNNKGRTDKKRIRIESIETMKEDGGDLFLRQHAWYDQSKLLPLLENSFRRITLVNKRMTERLTIDTEVAFRCLQSGQTASLNDIVIIELKRDGRTPSPIKEVLRKLHVQSSGFSKYCIGSALTSANLKKNRLKPKLRMLDKVRM